MWDTRESRCAEFEVNLILIDQGGNSDGGGGGGWLEICWCVISGYQ